MTGNPHQGDSTPASEAGKLGSPDTQPPLEPVAVKDDAAPTSAEVPAAPTVPPVERKRRDSIEIRLTRRNVLIAGATLAVGVGGLYWAMRSTGAAEEANQREQKKDDWQLPAMSGSPIQYKLFGITALAEGRMALPKGVRPPDWFAATHAVADRQRWILDNGGAWAGGIQFRLTIESLRRSVVLQSASIRFLNRGPVLDGTLIGMVAQGGGDATVSEIPVAGANLDHDRPVLRAISGDAQRRPLALGAPFPTSQITLDSHAFKAIDVKAEVRHVHTEWEVILEVLADGAAMDVPIRAGDTPFRTTGLATTYQTGFVETGTPEELSANRGRLQPRDPAQLLRGANG